MFLPFLPIMFASLALFLAETTPSQSINPILPLSGKIIIFLVLSLLAAQIRTRSIHVKGIELPLKKLLTFSLWLILIVYSQTDLQLQQYYKNLNFNKELSSFTLLLLYWLGDSLCSVPINNLNTESFIRKSQQTVSSLRIQLPILVLIFLQFIVSHLFDLFLATLPTWQNNLIILFISFTIIILFSPPILVLCWGGEKLSSKVSEKIILEELKESQTSKTKLITWPDSILPIKTAGVIGIVPGFRYLMINQQLINALSPLELRSVIAHEAGHLRNYHLIFFIIGFFAFNELLSLSYIGLGFVYEGLPPIWMMVAFTILGFVLFFRFIFGWLSRNFERQADCHALERLGFLPFRQALLKVAWLNGINTEEDNWHHYGIRQRLNFLNTCVDYPKFIFQHHQRVFKIKLLCIGTALTLLGFNVIFLSNQIQTQVFQFMLPQQIETLDLSNTHFPLSIITNLAIEYQINGNTKKAEILYRKLLKTNYENPLVLNNLAWLLVTNYYNEPEKIKESTQLAQQATMLEDSSYIWDTLAESYSKAGNHEEAFQAAQHAFTLAEQEKIIPAGVKLDYFQERLTLFRQLMKQSGN